MTTNIFLNEKAKQLNFKNFRGVVFRDDFWRMTPLRQECGIYGSKPRSENNHHWCAWYKNGNKIYCFDSYGLPPTKEIVNYFRGKKITYSTFQIQKFNEAICGEYCLYFLDRMNRGYNFFDVILGLINNSTF